MKKLLFVNCCIRQESRTEQLCRRYLSQLDGEYETAELYLPALSLRPFDEQMLRQRVDDIQNGTLDKQEYALARQFAEADRIVIAAPYWDASFPSLLKIYIEHICVNSITFSYGSGGKPVKLCRADHLVYITTAGGYIREHLGVQMFFEELCAVLGIEDMRFYCAQGLDIYPEKVRDVLDDLLRDMVRDLKRISTHMISDAKV